MLISILCKAQDKEIQYIKVIVPTVRDCGDDPKGFEKDTITVVPYVCNKDGHWTLCVYWRGKDYTLDAAKKLWRKNKFKYRVKYQTK